MRQCFEQGHVSLTKPLPSDKLTTPTIGRKVVLYVADMIWMLDAANDTCIHKIKLTNTP